MDKDRAQSIKDKLGLIMYDAALSSLVWSEVTPYSNEIIQTAQEIHKLLFWELEKALKEEV